MFGKRGSVLTTEELVKLVLGILVLIFLIILLVALVNIVLASKERTQATKTLDNLEYAINNAPDGNIKEFLIESPRYWTLIGSGKKICLCRLDDKIFQEKLDGFSPSCVKEGVCREFDRSVFVAPTCTIEFAGLWATLKNKFSNILNPRGWGSPTISECVYIFNPPVSINFAKTSDGVYIDDTLTLQKYRQDLVDKDCFVKLEMLNKNNQIRLGEKIDFGVALEKCDRAKLSFLDLNLLKVGASGNGDLACRYDKDEISTDNPVILSCEVQGFQDGKYKLILNDGWDYGYGSGAVGNEIEIVSDKTVSECAIKNVFLEKGIFAPAEEVSFNIDFENCKKDDFFYFNIAILSGDKTKQTVGRKIGGWFFDNKLSRAILTTRRVDRILGEQIDAREGEMMISVKEDGNSVEKVTSSSALNVPGTYTIKIVATSPVPVGVVLSNPDEEANKNNYWLFQWNDKYVKFSSSNIFEVK